MGARRVRRALGIVHFASLLVPRADRDRWLQEWRAEIIAAGNENPGRSSGRAGRIVRRSLLSFADAWVFRRTLCGRGAEGAAVSRGIPIDSFAQDLRFAWRSLLRRPATSALLLVTLALGIGASAAIWSVLYGIVLSPLAYDRPEEIVQVWPARSQGMSTELLVKLQEESTSYDGLAAWTEEAFKLAMDDRAEMVYGPKVTADFFHVLGGRTMLGRPFEAGDDRDGVRRVLLSHDFWQRQLGDDASVLGRDLTLSDTHFRVVGVLEPGFEIPRQGRFDVVVDHQVDPEAIDFGHFYLDVIARLKPGVSVAEAEFRQLALRWADESGTSPEAMATASVVSLHEFLVGDVRPALLLLFGAVGFIVLIVVANVAHLLLGRVLGRRTELRVRFALGASRGRVVRQLLTESTFLALLGGILGGLAAGVLGPHLLALLPQDLPRLGEIRLGVPVFAFAALVTLAIGLAVGLVPAIDATRRRARNGMTSRSASAGPSRHRLRASLVVAEVTLSVVLLAGAGVLVKSFWHTLQVDPGFEPTGLVHLTVLPGESSWPSSDAVDRYYEGLADAVRAVPGVTRAAMTHAVPVVNGGWVMGTYPSANPPAEGEVTSLARWRPISPGYFETAGIELVAGRPFTAEDRLGAEPVALLNVSAATGLFGGVRKALGDTIRIGIEGQDDIRVVGIVEDVRILGLREDAPRTAYRPYPPGQPRASPHQRPPSVAGPAL